MTENTRVEKEILDQARKYCVKKGIKLSWFISNALKNQLKREKK